MISPKNRRSAKRDTFATGFVYVANPYSHADPKVMATRYAQTARYVAKAMRRGDVVYSPIVHHHHMAIDHNLPSDWPFWRNIDGNMLARARGLRVLCLNGWRRSIGVQAEIAIAISLDIPVEYIQP